MKQFKTEAIFLRRSLKQFTSVEKDSSNPMTRLSAQQTQTLYSNNQSINQNTFL